MYKQLKKQGNVVDYVELPKGEHWRTIESNEKITLQRVQAFLRQHLTAPLQAAAAQ
jgi:dipeptidyl aminopeptidase/acylaminoacyl peptidase